MFKTFECMFTPVNHFKTSDLENNSLKIHHVSLLLTPNLKMCCKSRISQLFVLDIHNVWETSPSIICHSSIHGRTCISKLPCLHYDHFKLLNYCSICSSGQVYACRYSFEALRWFRRKTIYLGNVLSSFPFFKSD